MQGYSSLGNIGIEALTGFLSAFLNVRIIAPVIAGIALAATIGAGTTAQLGAMRVAEEIDAVEANVATGYHAIEFLLWGQDLHGTEAGAGERPASDFDPEGCTGDNCERRSAYLTTAADMLIADLEEMVANWGEGGEARAAVTANPDDGLRAMLTGLGSLSYGELAGEDEIVGGARLLLGQHPQLALLRHRRHARGL